MANIQSLKCISLSITAKHTDAWQILTKLEEVVPGMVMVAMRRISLERRIGDKEKTEMLFQEYIDKATVKNVRAFYVIKYSRYLFKVGFTLCLLASNFVVFAHSLTLHTA